MDTNSQKYFFELLKAGLWGQHNVSVVGPVSAVDWDEVYRLAEEQSAIGLIAAGFEQSGTPVPQMVKLQFVGATLQLEQRNKAMNEFIADLIRKMRKAGIYTLLVKGQGVAQCYERPLWRTCGDVDLFLSDDNYEKAKRFLMPLASSVETEYVRERHLGMTIDGWVVELHGRLYSGLSSGIERELDEVYRDTFYGGSVRSWDNDGVSVYQLKAENDAFYVFTHIMQHFYKEGVGLRQICDWCRLLWTYREAIDKRKLETRLRKAGLMTAWKAFAQFAVRYLGMPKEAMPFYSDGSRWDRKAARIYKYVMTVGNFGHNRDMSYFSTKPYLVRKTMSLGRRMADFANHFRIFPMDTLRFMPYIVFNGLRSAARGEG